ncbi:ABC transporter substrate-binding protein [Ignatzschineria sp. LJL83]
MTAQAAPKDSLVLAIGGESENGFDPISGWGTYGNPLFQSTLLRRGMDLETLPDLATAWELSDDRKTWTITLRPDVKFSNGDPLTSEDIVFTFEKARTGANSLDLSVLDSVKALDDSTVQFTLTKPWITFMEAFYTLGIVPKNSYDAGYSRNPIGSGPYKLIAWNEGEQLIVEKNPEYYGDSSDFKKITFLFTSEDSSLAAANTGSVDLVAVPAQFADILPPNFQRISIETVDNRGLSMPFTKPEVIEIPDQGKRNIGNAITSDLAIRQAINIGLDRDLILDVAVQNHGTKAFGPADGLPWAGKNDVVEYNLEAAKTILEDGGWHLQKDGIRSKDGLRASFKIHYPANDPSRQAIAEVVAELLNPLGIEATPKGGNWDSIGQIMHSEPVLFGFGSHSPYELYAIYSGNLSGIEYMNPSYYNNEAVNDLFQQAQTSQSIEDSLQHWSKAADFYGSQGDIAWIWLMNFNHVYFANECLSLGETQIEPHGHGWPITTSIAQWRWTCE